jgi:hypothetical protein
VEHPSFIISRERRHDMPQRHSAASNWWTEGRGSQCYGFYAPWRSPCGGGELGGDSARATHVLVMACADSVEFGRGDGGKSQQTRLLRVAWIEFYATPTNRARLARVVEGEGGADHRGPHTSEALVSRGLRLGRGSN